MYNDLEIGVLGLGAQGAKISKIIYKKFKKKILVYSSKKNLEIQKFVQTDKIAHLKKCKVIFICTPNFTHFKYLDYYKKTAQYIFCEKPPINKISEYKKLKKFPKKYKKKIYFNFNYLFSDKYRILKKKYQSKKTEKLIDISISVGNGISFKKKLLSNWRSNDKNIFSGIVGNIGIHYINLLEDLIGNIKINFIEFKKIGKFELPDTVIISISNKKNITGRIFLTYASPFHQNIKAIFSNSIIEIDNDKIIEYYPRNTFDKKNRFIKPKQKIIYNKKSSSIWNNTLKKSVEYFLVCVKKKKSFQYKKFDSNLDEALMIIKKMNEKN